MKKITYFLAAMMAFSCSSRESSLPSDLEGAKQDDINLAAAEDKEDIDALKKELDQIYHSDQQLRMLFTPDVSEEKRVEILSEFGYSLETFEEQGWDIVEKQDSINLQRIEQIIAQHGYPGKLLVGDPTNRSAYYVIQHSDKIAQYFPLIKEAGEKGDIPERLVAMMQDRLLVSQGKPQMYGTQIQGMMVINKATEEEEWFSYLWPVEDVERVDELRAELGFSTLEEYVVSMGLEYKLYTLEEIEEIIDH